MPPPFAYPALPAPPPAASRPRTRIVSCGLHVGISARLAEAPAGPRAPRDRIRDPGYGANYLIGNAVTGRRALPERQTNIGGGYADIRIRRGRGIGPRHSESG